MKTIKYLIVALLAATTLSASANYGPYTLGYKPREIKTTECSKEVARQVLIGTGAGYIGGGPKGALGGATAGVANALTSDKCTKPARNPKPKRK